MQFCCRSPCGSVDWNAFREIEQCYCVRRSPCGSVDWNMIDFEQFKTKAVAPLAGAWIEIHNKCRTYNCSRHRSPCGSASSISRIRARYNRLEKRISYKNKRLRGTFLERIYWRTGNRDCELYHRDKCDSKADSEKISGKQKYGTYGSNKIERLIWVIG